MQIHIFENIIKKKQNPVKKLFYVSNIIYLFILRVILHFKISYKCIKISSVFINNVSNVFQHWHCVRSIPKGMTRRRCCKKYSLRDSTYN